MARGNTITVSAEPRRKMEFDRSTGEKQFEGQGEVTMPWGKYTGQPLSDVPLSYLSYIMESLSEVPGRLRRQIEREVLRRVMISMRSSVQYEEESIEQASARHDREDADEGGGKREAAVQFAYLLLKGDPVAVDMFTDMTEKGV
jgi:uncharacterized protein (DUF3820 family)